MPTTTRDPGVPTRLTEYTPTDNRFVSRIYYAKAIQRFLLIDRHTRPLRRHWVVVKRISAGKIAIERFRGQNYLGVARILNTYQAAQSKWLLAALVAVLL